MLPQHMRVSDQASHSIFSICTCNHEVVVFYDTPSLVIFCFFPSNIFFCDLHYIYEVKGKNKEIRSCFFLILWLFHVDSRNLLPLTIYDSCLFSTGHLKSTCLLQESNSQNLCWRRNLQITSIVRQLQLATVWNILFPTLFLALSRSSPLTPKVKVLCLCLLDPDCDESPE